MSQDYPMLSRDWKNNDEMRKLSKNIISLEKIMLYIFYLKCTYFIGGDVEIVEKIFSTLKWNNFYNLKISKYLMLCTFFSCRWGFLCLRYWILETFFNWKPINQWLCFQIWTFRKKCWKLDIFTLKSSDSGLN